MFKKRSGSVIILTIFIALSVFLVRGLKLDPHHIPSALINKKMPAFNLPELQRPNLHIASQQWLGKPALINVWASWCASCVEDHEFLMQLVKNENIVIYGLNYKDNSDAAKQWLNEHGNPYKTIVTDNDGKTAIDWGVYGTPETFLIDENGIIRFKQVGVLTADVWEQEIKPLLRRKGVI